MSETQSFLGVDLVPDRYIVTRIAKQRSHTLAALVVESATGEPRFFRAKTSATEGLAERRINREAEILSQLQHPQIPAFVEHGLTGDQEVPYIVTGRAPSNPHWKQRVDNFPSVERVVNFFLSALKPLDYAHSRGIVHRDICDENFTVSNFWEAWLVDFELATADKNAEADLGPSALRVKTKDTNDGTICGTFQYISPEGMTESDYPVNAQSDVYSMGILMYRLLYGKLPFSGKGEFDETVEYVKADDIRNVLDQRINLADTFDRRIPEGLMEIIALATFPHPILRYENAGHMLEAVERFAVDSRISSYAA